MLAEQQVVTVSLAFFTLTLDFHKQYLSPDCEKQPHTETRGENKKPFHFRLYATSPRVPCFCTMGEENVSSQPVTSRKSITPT